MLYIWRDIMDVFSAIKSRKSIRAYKDKEIEEEKLQRILEAGRLAPSAANRQEWKFIAVRDGETKEKLAVAAKGQMFVAKAPVVIVACAVESSRVMACGQYAYTVDLSIAMSYMILEAHELGIGSCWLGAFYEEQVKSILGIPDDVRIVTMVPMGYPAESPERRSRKGIDEIICYDRYK